VKAGPVRAVEIALAVGWALFWAYWLASAFSVKRGRVPWSREFAIRVMAAVVVAALVRAGVFRTHGVTSDPWRGGAGLILWAVGLAFAVWARVHLGRNWGSPMSQKEDLELVTSGPYRLVRHPIYTGILVAGAGTAVALSWTWLIVVAFFAAYFGYSAVVEERNLAKRLPDSYPAYRSRTKMLVPYVF